MRDGEETDLKWGSRVGVGNVGGMVCVDGVGGVDDDEGKVARALPGNASHGLQIDGLGLGWVGQAHPTHGWSIHTLPRPF